MALKDGFRIGDEAERLLKTIESTFDEHERVSAINTLAASNNEDAGRILIEVFGRCMWRSTKISIIKVLGGINRDRVIEFLIGIASNHQDLVFAKEAIISLSMSESAVVGEFLLTFLSEKEHVLCREAVMGLSNMLYFPSERGLVRVLDGPSSEKSPALLQYVVIALARRGCAYLWNEIEPFLKVKPDKEIEVVFNAALIAAGLLGDRNTADELRRLDTRYYFFSNQLKIAAIERIEMRSRRTVEDAVSALVSAKDADERRQALQFLKEFPKDEAWEAFLLFLKDVDPELSCLARIILFNEYRRKEDAEFILKHRDDVNHDILSALLRLHAEISEEVFLEDFYTKLPTECMISFMSRVKDKNVLDRLGNIIHDPKQKGSVRIKAINAVVSQVFIGGMNRALVLSAGKLLFDSMKCEDDLKVKNRIIRALGQIEYDEPALFIELGLLLKDKERRFFASVYAALSKIRAEESANVILRRIKIIASQDDRDYEMQRAIHALAFMEKLPDSSILSNISKRLFNIVRMPILKILSFNPVCGMTEFVLESLGREDFQTRILAIAASKYNNNPEIFDKLFELLDDNNASLSTRSLDSLCIGGSHMQHKKLIAWLKNSPRSREIVLKVFRSMTPDPDCDYSDLIDPISNLLSSHYEVFHDTEVRGAARNLMDNLHMSSQNRKRNTAVSKSSMHHEEAKLDKKMAGYIIGLPRYSESVRSVLRNAELTYGHSELFDKNVDKSTIVIEYVKSIDILLQERVGSQIFLSPGSRLLFDMQTRILQMQLDDESVLPAQIVRSLQCEKYFDLDSFPYNKLLGLSRDVLTGKILHDQYRSIDGLRAWSLLMLMFGRKFKFGKVQIEAIFTLKSSENERICRLSSDMNKLQDIRNQAAHRGTVLETSNLEEVRSLSLDVLNKLEGVLK